MNRLAFKPKLEDLCSPSASSDSAPSLRVKELEPTSRPCPRWSEFWNPTPQIVPNPLLGSAWISELTPVCRNGSLLECGWCLDP